MALSTFTSIEKQSLYQLLCGAMIIDGNRDAREIAVINEVSTLRSMDTLKKAYVGKFMAQVILADGVVSQKEEQFFYYMHELLDLPNMD